MPSWSDIQYWNDSPVIEAANNLTDSYHKFRAQADEAAAARTRSSLLVRLQTQRAIN